MRRLNLGWFLGKVASLAIAAATVWAIHEVVEAPQLVASSARISGSDLVPAEELATSLSIGGQNVFQIRARRLATLLEAHPAIKSAQVRPSLNGIVYVTVTERAPVAVWDSGQQQVLVDEDGIALREGNRDLPTIHSSVAGLIPEGGKVDVNAVHMATYVDAALDDLGLSGARLEFDPGAGMTVVGAAQRVLMGTPDQVDAKISAYRTIRNYLEQSRIAAQLVDVRSLDRPYFR